MDHSMFLASFLGVVFVVYGLALLFNSKKFKAAFEAAKNCAGVCWIIGVVQLFIGSFLIVSQEVWMGWMVLVTLVGWVLFLMAVSRLWFSRCSTKCHSDQKAEGCGTSECSKGSSCIKMIGLIVLVWGVALVYFGFFGGDMNNVMGMMHHMGQMSNSAQ